jgi:hypothetical protein
MLHFLHPLGLWRMNRSRSTLRNPPQWVVWHLRNIVRNAGIPAVSLTPGYLAEHLGYLKKDEVEDQEAYHTGTAEMYQKLAKRLYGLSFFAFLVGVGCFSLRAWASAYHYDELIHASIERSGWYWRCYGIKVGSLVFPALGAVLAGIRSHGEFARLSGRSEMMKDFFEHKAKRLVSLEANGLYSWEQSVLVTREITEEMQMEISEWRTTIGGKNLTFPF